MVVSEGVLDTGLLVRSGWPCHFHLVRSAGSTLAVRASPASGLSQDSAYAAMALFLPSSEAKSGEGSGVTMVEPADFSVGASDSADSWTPGLGGLDLGSVAPAAAPSVRGAGSPRATAESPARGLDSSRSSWSRQQSA